MELEATAVEGVWLITPSRVEDERGFFARTWDRDVFAQLGLNTKLAACSVSFNRQRGTLRGMHWQKAPHAEAKLVRCTRGAVYDVALDVRPGSPTYGRHAAATLTADDHRMLYIPEGCAHGFITLDDDSELFYQLSVPYAPESATGLRWDDPAFAIPWPLAPTLMAPRDASYPDHEEERP